MTDDDEKGDHIDDRILGDYLIKQKKFILDQFNSAVADKNKDSDF